MLGGVAEVVSSNPRWVIKYFSAFTGIVDLLRLSISIFSINLYQFLILYIYILFIHDTIPLVHYKKVCIPLFFLFQGLPSGA